MGPLLNQSIVGANRLDKTMVTAHGRQVNINRAMVLRNNERKNNERGNNEGRDEQLL
jgi:hypothetical protein